MILHACILILGSGCRQEQKARRMPPVTEIEVGAASAQPRILRGVYAGDEGWRWTARAFAVSLDPPPLGKRAFLEMDYSLPIEVMKDVMQDLRSVTVTANVNGVPVAKERRQKDGRYKFSHPVPAEALRRRPAEVEFSLDHAGRDNQGREIGLIVVAIGLKEYEETVEFREQQLRLSNEGYQKILQQRGVQLPREKQNEMMKLFHELPVWENTWFHNIRIIKNPIDLWMMQQIIYEVQPDFVIETGTWMGGSALYFAHTLHGMGLVNSRVLTVDIQDFTQEGASAHPLWKKYVEFFLGSSTDPGIVAAIQGKVQGKKAVVALDSDHKMLHVLQEMKLYAPMVSRGSYLVVEDTHMDGIPTHPEMGAGPMTAVRAFLEQGGRRDFEQDLRREAMVMTFNPGGWLRRK